MSVRPKPDLALAAASQQDSEQLSLWDRAYEDLRSQSDIVSQYEELLGKQLAAVQPQQPNEHGSLVPLSIKVSGNSDDRQTQLDQIIKQSLDSAGRRSTLTIFGHEFVPKNQAAQAAQLIKSIQGLVAEAVKVSPEASLAWAGVCVLLPVFTIPQAAEEASRSGLAYVNSRVHYYVELEHLLWPSNLQEPRLKTQLEKHIIDLYLHIVEFQIKIVLRFHDTWLARFRHDILGLEEWEGMITKIKELERAVQDASNH